MDPIVIDSTPLLLASSAITLALPILAWFRGRRSLRSGLRSDLAREKQARVAAEAEKNQLYGLFMQAPAFITIHRGPDHVYSFSNYLNNQILGHSNALGRPLREVIQDFANREAISEAFDRIYAQGKPIFFGEFPVARDWLGDGKITTRYLNAVGQPTFDPQGKVDGVMSFSIDITAQTLARQEPIQNQKRLDMALRAARLNLWEWDVRTDSVWRSENHDQLFGLPQNLPQFTRGDFMAFIHPDDRSKVSQRIQAVLEGTLDYDLEYRVIWPDQSVHWLYTTGQLFRDEAGQPLRLSGCSVDITERKRTEEEMKNAQSALEKAVRTRDEFLSIASHELKTPITSLKLQLEMTKRKIDPQTGTTPSAEKLAKVIDVSTTQVDRLTSLVDELLDVSRIDAGKMGLHLEKVDLALVIRETIERHREQLKAARCAVRMQDLPSISVSIDRFRIEQVISNLLTNAIKYAAGKPIEIRIEESTNQARICIHDHGMGIPKENQSRIFDRFERAVSAKNISGLGLGLYIAREIVQAHRGTIRVESEPGAGSTFMIEIPRS